MFNGTPLGLKVEAPSRAKSNLRSSLAGISARD